MTEISRRRLLRSSGVAGVTVAAGLVGLRPAVEAEGKAVPELFGQFRPHEVKKYEIHGHTVTVGESSKELVVTVDDHKLDHMHMHRDGRRYLSMMYPFTDFVSAESLVTALVEGDGSLFIM